MIKDMNPPEHKVGPPADGDWLGPRDRMYAERAKSKPGWKFASAAIGLLVGVTLTATVAAVEGMDRQQSCRDAIDASDQMMLYAGLSLSSGANMDKAINKARTQYDTASAKCWGWPR